VSLANHIFTVLPNGSAADASPSLVLTTPSQWALQVIFMADATDPNNWFVPNSSVLPRFTANNKVTHLIDGLPTFRKMVATMRTITNSDHYLRLAGWWLTDSFELVPGDPTSTFAQLTQNMDAGGAQVRVMLWDQWGTQNTDEINHINALPGGNGRGILDDETFLVGSHHQKFMILNGSGGALAFCGGIDLNPDRLDDDRHMAPSPFHDTHAMVEGPAVGDLNTSFIERWNGHPSSPPPIASTPPPFASNPGTHYVQVTRTYAPRFGYPFAPGGDLGTLDAVRNAIQRAERFIYLEEQYATPYPGPYPFSAADDSVGVLTDLLNTLAKPGFEYLIIVIPNNTDQPQNRFRRRQFIRPMKDAHPSKVFVFYPARNFGPGVSPPGSTTAITDKDLETIEATGSEPSTSASSSPSSSSSSGGPSHANEIYVHSKVWIIDDVYAKIGSANCNRRSYTHDTEIDISVIDGALENGGRAFAKRLRMDLWAELLDMRGAKRALLDDPTHALHYWKFPPAGAYIRSYDETRGGFPIHTDFNWNNFYDPDGR
jgi:phosphatidylserine/phosphatidylglycerophosphate/cardiolipin synthase-like enzyme